MRVYGLVDGIEVEFPHKEGNLYELKFPFKMNSGKYIIEIYAKDEAGNISYRSTVLCAIGADGVCLHAINEGYFLKAVQEKIALQSMRLNVYLEAIAPRMCKGGIGYGQIH